MVNQKFATALHILTVLGCQQNTLINSESLATSVKTNPVVIRRLLAELIKSKLVNSTRGKSGGVQLARPPSQINLKDIYLAVSAPQLITPLKKTPFKKCPVSCSMQSIITSIAVNTQKATDNYLESQKLSDIIKMVPT